MTLRQRVVLVAAAGAACLVGTWPAQWVRKGVLQVFEHPAYEGVWILIPHLFLYSTLQALFCFAAWRVLVRREYLPAMKLSLRPSSMSWGFSVGLVSAAMVVAYFFATGQQGAFHAPRINPWIATANIFSNFFEEYVFRGFLLATLGAALGFWPAAVLTSLAFAATHTQYPLSLQALIAAVALLWAWVGRRTDGLLAPYTAHMTLDWLIDPFV